MTYVKKSYASINSNDVKKLITTKMFKKYFSIIICIIIKIIIHQYTVQIN